MKYAALFAILLSGCASMPDLPPGASTACTKLVRPWGTFVFVVSSTDKGTLKNGDVSVDDNCKTVVTNSTPVKQ